MFLVLGTLYALTMFHLFDMLILDIIWISHHQTYLTNSIPVKQHEVSPPDFLSGCTGMGMKDTPARLSCLYATQSLQMQLHLKKNGWCAVVSFIVSEASTV